MKVLLCLDKFSSNSNLGPNLLEVIKCFQLDEIFIDIFHIHPLRKSAKNEENKAVVEEIHKDEFNAKVRTVAAFENELEKHLSDNAGCAVLVNSIVAKGDFRKTIEDHIIFNRYDLMVLNPPKKSTFSLVLKGSNTNWIMDTLEIPVMILPEELDFVSKEESKCICFVDNAGSYENIAKTNIVDKISDSAMKYIFFGRDNICENVETITSSNPLQSISEYTSTSDHNNICILHHKNKGDFLNLLDKSFTKELLKSLENPLIIF